MEDLTRVRFTNLDKTMYPPERDGGELGRRGPGGLRVLGQVPAEHQPQPRATVP